MPTSLIPAGLDVSFSSKLPLYDQHSRMVLFEPVRIPITITSEKELPSPFSPFLWDARLEKGRSLVKFFSLPSPPSHHIQTAGITPPFLPSGRSLNFSRPYLCFGPPLRNNFSILHGQSLTSLSFSQIDFCLPDVLSFFLHVRVTLHPLTFPLPFPSADVPRPPTPPFFPQRVFAL